MVQIFSMIIDWTALLSFLVYYANSLFVALNFWIKKIIKKKNWSRHPDKYNISFSLI